MLSNSPNSKKPPNAGQQLGFIAAVFHMECGDERSELTAFIQEKRGPPSASHPFNTFDKPNAVTS